MWVWSIHNCQIAKETVSQLDMTSHQLNFAQPEMCYNWVVGGKEYHGNSQIVKAVGNLIGYSPQTVGKALLLKTPLPDLIEHRAVEMAPI